MERTDSLFKLFPCCVWCLLVILASTSAIMGQWEPLQCCIFQSEDRLFVFLSWCPCLQNGDKMIPCLIYFKIQVLWPPASGSYSFGCALRDGKHHLLFPNSRYSKIRTLKDLAAQHPAPGDGHRVWDPHQAEAITSVKTTYSRLATT